VSDTTKCECGDPTGRWDRDLCSGCGGELPEPDLAAENERLRRALRKTQRAVIYELSRGYVLTNEPGAGSAWRTRWNECLADIEAALAAAKKEGA
jgi:hypothetical protein